MFSRWRPPIGFGLSALAANERKFPRCAVYTRKSSEHGLEQDFNSLDAQREAAEAHIKSQAHEGWRLVKARYDDGGLSGGTLERPALQSLLADIKSRKVDVVVVYKVDRLTRSLADFAKLVELFEAHGVSFVAVTQQFNTTTSMGRLTLNVLLSFAQFERELAGERIRDKFAASRRKGMWMGGTVPLGYEVKDRKLVINEEEAERVRLIFRQYLALGCVSKLRADLDQRGIRSKQRVLTFGRVLGGCSFGRGALYHLLKNRIYRGEVVHKGITYPGEHKAIVDEELWDAVQARLTTNRTTRRKTRVETGALLTGLIYDDGGNIMSPTYSVCRGNRYRYYISSASLRDRRSEAGSRARVNADDIEQLVVERLGRELSRPDLSAGGASAGWSTETRAVVRDTIERVVVQGDELQIVRKPAAGSAAATQAGDDGPQVHRAPLPAPRPRARKEIIFPGGQNSSPRRVNHALILAIARAKSSMRDLRSGRYADTAEISQQFQLNKAHVGRLTRFGYLAPDIVEAIIEGRQPRSMTVKRLLRGVPCLWADQRAAFGLAR
jgi:DNA invertase Pin-like site-specific DNA recombinase